MSEDHDDPKTRYLTPHERKEYGRMERRLRKVESDPDWMLSRRKSGIQAELSIGLSHLWALNDERRRAEAKRRVDEVD